MQTITSKENALIKQIIKLKEKKHRDTYCKYLIEGVKLIKEAIQEKAKIDKIIISEDALNSSFMQKNVGQDIEKFECIKVPNNIFKLLTEVENPQGILAIIDKPLNEEKIDYTQDIILALDDVQDPGNLGTIIRTADSVGLKQIIVSKGTVDAYNSKVIRSTMGAMFRVKIIIAQDFAKTLEEIKQKNYEIMVTSLDAKKSIYDINLKNKIIVIGNEANGVSKEVINLADEKAIIPMLGKAESLNASVATGVILYEYVRQKINSVNM